MSGYRLLALRLLADAVREIECSETKPRSLCSAPTCFACRLRALEFLSGPSAKTLADGVGISMSAWEDRVSELRESLYGDRTTRFLIELLWDGPKPTLEVRRAVLDAGIEWEEAFDRLTRIDASISRIEGLFCWVLAR